MPSGNGALKKSSIGRKYLGDLDLFSILGQKLGKNIAKIYRIYAYLLSSALSKV